MAAKKAVRKATKTAKPAVKKPVKKAAAHLGTPADETYKPTGSSDR
jgi:hypothetical protein